MWKGWIGNMGFICYFKTGIDDAKLTIDTWQPSIIDYDSDNHVQAFYAA